MRKTNKKGFTIVELVIVIAVIAILAAVLIPTYSSLVKKANRSADIQAVREMNTALVADSAEGDPTELQKVLSILKGAGIDAKDYKAMSDGYQIVWDKEQNRILYVNGKTVEYPEEYNKAYEDKYILANWVQLTGQRAGDNSWKNDSNGKDKGETISDNKYLELDVTGMKKYTVSTPAQLVSFAEEVRNSENNGADMIIELEKGKSYDMLGAEWECIPEFAGIFNGNGATITNLAITDKTLVAENTLTSATKNPYGFYAFVSVFTGQYFGNVTLEVNVDNPGKVYTSNHTVAGAIGAVYPKKSTKVVVDNVTVNGTVRGAYRAAGVVGFVGGGNSDAARAGGEATIKNCVNNAAVTSYLCAATYNTAAGIVSTSNWVTTDYLLTIENCTNNGTISGQIAAGIMANSFAASNSQYETGDVHSEGKVHIKNNKNTGTIIASHTGGYTKDTTLSTGEYIFTVEDGCMADQIYNAYHSQSRLYVWGSTQEGSASIADGCKKSSDQLYNDNAPTT